MESKPNVQTFPLLKGENITTMIQHQILHDALSFSVEKGEVFGIVGGSGMGKSVLLRVILGLLPKERGSLFFLNQSLDDPATRHQLRQSSGVLFQSGALFSSLTVEENIAFPLRHLAHIPQRHLRDLVHLRLLMVGLDGKAAQKYPQELSGGMIKRVALARALIMDPCILFLDEPTAGLDPISSAKFHQLVKTLQTQLGLTLVIVTHELKTLDHVCDRIGVLLDGKMIVGDVKSIKNNPHPWIQSYFHAE